MEYRILWLILSLSSLLIMTACGPDSGSDALTEREPAAPAPNAALCNGVCHSPDSEISPDPLQTNGSGTAGKHVIHVETRGIYCTKCHFNYENETSHVNGQLDTGSVAIPLVNFDATNPSGNWNSGAANCSSLGCHGSSTLDWYGIAGWTLPACASCHEAAVGTKRVILGVNGDFGASATTVSHHVVAAAVSTDPTDEQCKVCHEMSKHMAGTVRLQNADIDDPDVPNSVIAYDPSVPASLEPFCLSCHDALGASAATVPVPGGSAKSPFADDRTLGAAPNVAGDKIEGYWNNNYTVHKDNSLTCAGSGDPGTGCHGNGGTINMHGSVTKGLLTKNLTLPVPQLGDLYDYNYYKLCFDCHASYPEVSKEVVLGVKQFGNYDVPWAMIPFYTSGIQSLFRDRYVDGTTYPYPAYWGGVNQPYNSNFYDKPYAPLHNWHLSNNNFMEIAWNYRGTTVETGEVGRASCITCHNVHGTSGTVRSTYDELGITAFVSDFPGGYQDSYKKLVPIGNYQDTVLKEYPMSCRWSCHGSGLRPGSSYWHTPSDE